MVCACRTVPFELHGPVALSFQLGLCLQALPGWSMDKLRSLGSWQPSPMPREVQMTEAPPQAEAPKPGVQNPAGSASPFYFFMVGLGGVGVPVACD